jgi:hypothetical protein
MIDSTSGDRDGYISLVFCLLDPALIIALTESRSSRHAMSRLIPHTVSRVAWNSVCQRCRSMRRVERNSLAVELTNRISPFLVAQFVLMINNPSEDDCYMAKEQCT